MKINIPVSIGELYDKLTILEIKKNKIADEKKLLNIVLQHNILHEIAISVSKTYQTDNLYIKLFHVNRILWHIEEQKRIHEKHQCFDAVFILFSRCVYLYNDTRAGIKKEIDMQYNSFITEEKSY